MKLLIVYASAGAGHRRAAEAIYESLDDSLKQESSLVDILDFTPSFFKFTYSKGYIFLISRISWLWSFFYWLTNLGILSKLINLLRRASNSLMTKRFVCFLNKNNPQVVLSTHFLSSEVLSNLKKRKKIDSFHISIITDYTIHGFWLNDGVDKFIVGLQFLKDILIKKGIEKDKILDLGIPVDKSFLNLKSRQVAAEITGVNPNKFTALLVTGAIGLNCLGRIASVLKDNMQTIVICGKNKKLLHSLEKIGSNNLILYPLVSNMADFLACSDVIITKAGGLTVTESLIAQIPMCFISRIGGQEAANIEVFTTLGCAFYERRESAVIQRLLEFSQDPKGLTVLKQNLARYARCDANSRIISFLKEHVR
ncbi:MAG: hypothetical protein KJ593_05865 [Candidatus Omnitrophica bacterium]|nr:hypothetical protein [Candidatus Omnitrophota bacterium]